MITGVHALIYTKNADDVRAFFRDLLGFAVDEGWGLATSIQLPGGSALGLYQPRHPTAFEAS